MANRAKPETALADSSEPPARFDHSPPAREWRYVVLHHSGAPVGSVSSIDEEHRSRSDSEGRRWLGIGYHFVIGNGRGMDDGEVQPTFRWRQQLAGAHAGVREYNEDGIGICLIGDFSQQPPSRRQLAACERLVADLCSDYELPASRVIRHSDVKATECPGGQFPYTAVADAAQRRTESLPNSARRHGTTQRF